MQRSFSTSTSFSPIGFQTTCTMAGSGSAYAPSVYAVGAPRVEYIGAFSAPRHVPGTGDVTPVGYDEGGGTGFDAPVGSSLVLLAFALAYFCIKKIKIIPKLFV